MPDQNGHRGLPVGAGDPREEQLGPGRSQDGVGGQSTGQTPVAHLKLARGQIRYEALHHHRHRSGFHRRDYVVVGVVIHPLPSEEEIPGRYLPGVLGDTGDRDVPGSLGRQKELGVPEAPSHSLQGESGANHPPPFQTESERCHPERGA